MEKSLNYLLTRLMFAMLLLGLVSVACEDDGTPAGPQLTGNSEQYTLFSRSDPGISGTVTFAERNDGVTVITIDLNGTVSGGDHPAHIHGNTAVEGGGILLDLTNVDGATGESVTEVNALNDGTPVTYSELINFDGYVNVHLSGTELAVLVAQGDIGQNALTGTSVQYTLNSVSNPGINGTATFAERKGGSTLITLDLAGTSDGFDHPAHIHENDAATGGGIVATLNDVVGLTGLSVTNVSMLDDATAITYDELVTFNGYINVHLSDSELTVLVAQGNIGSNAN